MTLYCVPPGSAVVDPVLTPVSSVNGPTPQELPTAGVAIRETSPLAAAGETEILKGTDWPWVTLTAVPPLRTSVVVDAAVFTEDHLVTAVCAFIEPKPVARSYPVVEV